jgi:hypothetical protein
MSELFISLVSGTVGGIIVFLVQKFWDVKEKKSEIKKSLTIDPAKNKKILPKDILTHLTPGLSIEKAREFLGIPDNSYLHHEPEFDEATAAPQIYFYNFHNAALKLGSTDRTSIDSITIFAIEGQKQKIEIFPNQYEQAGRGMLGVAVIDNEIIEHATKHFDMSTGRERIFGIETYFGRLGGYFNYTYFGTDYKSYDKYNEHNDIQLLKGEVIMGFCVSSNGFAPLISIYEMR